MDSSLPATELLHARPTFQITNSKMDISSIRHAAGLIDELIAPSIMEQVAELPGLPGSFLPHPALFKSTPSALFALNPKLGIADVPPTWIEAYIGWASRLKRTRQITAASAQMQRSNENNCNCDCYRDPIVAGLMVFAYSPEPGTKLRQTLFENALKTPMGAYICAESLHSTSERAEIINALACDSIAVLGGSRIQTFGGACLHQALAGNDLASGLVVARLGTDAELAEWLRTAGLAACEESAAAMLALNPTAPKGLRGLWLATLQESKHVADAYAAVYWSRQTWPEKEWLVLKSALKATVTAEGSGWFNWYAQIEPEHAVTALAEEADPLWSFELLDALNLDPDRLRFWLTDRLGRLTYDLGCNLVLAALEHREQLRRKGDLYGTNV